MDNIQIKSASEFNELLYDDLANCGEFSAVRNIVVACMDGMPNLIKLFQMDNDTLKTTLDKLIGESLPRNIIPQSTITKTIVDDVAISITLNHYDKIDIDTLWIAFEWENGDSKKIIKTSSLKI